MRVVLAVAISSALMQTFAIRAAFSQSTDTTTYLDPLISGAQSTAANTAPAAGASPPAGSGSTPIGVPSGQTGAAQLPIWIPNAQTGGAKCPPWIPNFPANDIDLQDSELNLPYSNSQSTEPGKLGGMLAPYIPHAPSTPGSDPGILQTVGNYPTDAYIAPVGPNGGLPDGYAPTTRRGGQHTQDFGLTRTSGSLLTDFGQPLLQVPNLAQVPNCSQDGPRPLTYDSNLTPTRALNLPSAQETTNSPMNASYAPANSFCYGNRTLFKGPGVYAQMTEINY
jgi:hypothetical protein